MNKLTPNLIVDEIERCLPFWIDRLGFQKVVQVPQEGRLDFVVLQRRPVSVMLQSRTSLMDDVPSISDMVYRSVLYLNVDDLDAIRRALGDWPRITERETFYGAREIVVYDPAGNVVFFAQHQATA